jgi:hypothetical protein
LRVRGISFFAAIACASSLFPGLVSAQRDQPDQEIVADLAGGRAIALVAKDGIVFATIDQPVEEKGVPPRVLSIDSRHIGVLFGASEWQVPADPHPVRLDRNFARFSAPDPQYRSESTEGDLDLETVGVAFLEKLRPLVAQLHHKVEISPDEPILKVVLIGYGPHEYGPEMWTLEYRMEQSEIATTGDYWQTRVLRPRFEQLYPPEKHEPHLLVETRYPIGAKGPMLQDLIQGNDPRVQRVVAGDERFAKVLDQIQKGETQKADLTDATDFLRAVLPFVAGNSHFTLGTMAEYRGLNWIVPPEEPVEKTPEDKNRPPEAPTLRRRPSP